jgi:hypothetical protein
MRIRVLTIVAGLVLAACALVTAVATPPADADGVVASLHFYSTAPAGWQSRPVGTLLKWNRERDTSYVLRGLKGYRVMYVSRGAVHGPARGGKVFETGMVYLPAGKAAPGGGWPVVAWGHGTSGVGDSAAPSRYPWLYPEPVNDPWRVYGRFVGKAGRLGAIVTCPDYEGLGTPGMHTYLNRDSEGRAMIDAVRAARQLAADLGVPASRRWVGAGHSQGGQAAIAAAELASTYGRDLICRGSIGLAPGDNLLETMKPALTDAEWYPYLGYMAWGVKANDTTHRFAFSDMLGPWVLDVVRKAPRSYFDQWWALLLLAHWDGTYPGGAAATPTADQVAVGGWDTLPAVERFFADAQLGLRKATGPILIVQGTDDLLYSTYHEMLDQLRGAGDHVTGMVLKGRDHDQAVPGGTPAALNFLQKHLIGG